PRAPGGGAIEFTVFNGRSGQTNVIEASTDLITWSAISTNVFPSTVCPNCPFIDFQDPASTNLSRRFYRAFWLPCRTEGSPPVTPVSPYAFDSRRFCYRKRTVTST